MKKTVGDLINEQIEQNRGSESTIKLPKNWVSPLAETFETMEKISKQIEEPMRAAAKVAAAVQPQIDLMQKMKLPDMSGIMTGLIIPDRLRDEDGELYIPPLVRPAQEVRIVNPESLNQAHMNYT